MAWVKIDDQFYDHPKWADAPCDSIAVWLAAIAWCNRNDSLDGYIPANKLAGLTTASNLKRTTNDLVKRHAFEPHQAGFLVHDYAEYQQSEKVQKIREARSINGKKGAAARWGKGQPPPEPPPPHEWQLPSDLPMPTEQQEPSQLPWQNDAPYPYPDIDLPSSDDLRSQRPAPEDDDRRAHERREAVVQAYAELAWTQANQAAISSPGAFKNSKRTEARNHPDLERWSREYPDARPGEIAAWLAGDRHSMRYHERQATA